MINNITLFPNEIIKNIKTHENIYGITSHGRVWSYARKGSGNSLIGKFLTPYQRKQGYLTIDLKHKNKVTKCYIHRLVAQHFLPLIVGKDIVNHINGIKTDNRVENLEWCTWSENELHKSRILKLRIRPVFCNQLNKTFDSITIASELTGIHLTSIVNACSGKYKTAGKHPETGEQLQWKYIN